MPRASFASGRRVPESTAGLAYTVAAFLVWGLSPIFWKLLADVPAMELLAHRIVWCGLLMLGLLVGRRQWRGLGPIFRRRRTLLALLLSTACIGANWFLYIFAVTSDRILAASLGYFINPLVSVVLGLAVLGERLRPLQWASVALASLGVVVLTLQVGSLPWISLSLAGSFAFYGLLRKTVAATPEQGLALETWVLSPICLVFLAKVHASDAGGAFASSSLTAASLGANLLLVATGLITALPLLLFTHGARRLPLSTVGLLQYIAPTCQFLLAVFVYGEPFDRGRLLAFCMIWIALVLQGVALHRVQRNPSNS